MLKSRFKLLCGSLFVLALALRLFYAFDSKVEDAIVGDINYYTLYAWNLEQTQTFSSSLPNDEKKFPDSFRGPGYPMMLAAMMAIAGNAKISIGEGTHGRSKLIAEPSTWMTFAYIFQSVLGALSVLIAIAIARFWLAEEPSLLVGLSIALWPHLIVFCATLLSETLFGFSLLLALWMTLKANRGRQRFMAGGAGMAFGAAYLINPVVALLPLLIAIGFALQRRTYLAIIFAAAYLLLPLSWAARNTTIDADSPGATSRLVQNFVEGSWPQFLTALNSRFANETSAEIVAAEADEEKVFETDPKAGFQLVRERMALDPLYYINWYLFEKPYLLWAWSVRVGWGDIYFLATPVSPFARIALLKGIKYVFALLNPTFFVFALFAICLAAVRSIRNGIEKSFPLFVIASAVVYFTGVHVVLQAEPRYSIPYRPEEVLLAITASTWLVDRFARTWTAQRNHRMTELAEMEADS